MATIIAPPQPAPTVIDTFLGLNESTSGDTQLKLGESPQMKNFRLTEDYKLRKRNGYTQLFASLGSFDIQGMWYGELAGTTRFLFSANGSLYSHDLETGINSVIGSMSNSRTFFFSFGGKVYMLSGFDYKSYDGTTFGDVAGYVPLIATATPPTGGGTENEGINVLTGKKRQRFSADGTATAYQLAETSIGSVDSVKVNGVTKSIPADYSVNLTTGVVTFTSAPATGVDNVEIAWTKGSGDRTAITAMRFAMIYGGANDSRVFFYGDGSNRYRYTGLADGVPSAEYIPALNYRDISSSQYAVTDIVRQYDRQIIYNDGGEAWYSYYDPITIDGNTVADFPTFPLNQTIGNVAPGQTRVLRNNPVTLWNGVQEWTATNVRDERNVSYISKRVQPSIDAQNLSMAVTVDWERMGEYWICFGRDVIVYNYRLDVWYKFELAHYVTCLMVAENDLYFGTDGGQIMKFGDEERTDNGIAIAAHWEMGFYAFGAEYLQKFINEMWIALKPDDLTSISVSYQTERNASSPIFSTAYHLASFANLDFSEFTFKVNYNPQPFRLKIKAKKFVYFKLIIENAEITDKLTVLSINLAARFGAKVR